MILSKIFLLLMMGQALEVNYRVAIGMQELASDATPTSHTPVLSKAGAASTLTGYQLASYISNWLPRIS